MALNELSALAACRALQSKFGLQPLPLPKVPTEAELPPLPKRTYGKLTFLEIEGRGWWYVETEPHVRLRMKDMFRQITKYSTDVLKISDSPQNCRDLEWFMARYPLVMDFEARRRLVKGAREFDTKQASLERLLMPDYKPRTIEMAVPLRPYQMQFVELWLAGNRLLNGDDVGCISGDMTIAVSRAQGSRRMKLRDLYHKFHGGVSRSTYRWDPSFETRTSSMGADGMLLLNTIKDVVFQGFKPVRRVSIATESKQYVIELTDDHEVFSGGEWKRIDSLGVGDRLTVNGVKYCSVCKEETEHVTYRFAKFVGQCKRCVYRLHRRNTIAHPNGVIDEDGYVVLRHGLKRHPYDGIRGIPQHRLVLEAQQNGLSYEEFLRRIRMNELQGLAFIDPRKFAVHHANGVKTDNRVENLMLLTHSEHMRLHSRLSDIHHMRVHEGVITSIEPNFKTVDVYDLVMDGDRRNFVANGVVVHNCGKSAEAIGGLVAEKRMLPALVVCQTHLPHQWGEMFTKFAPGMRVHKIMKMKPYNLPPADVYTISYSKLLGWVDVFATGFFRAVVFDECQELRCEGSGKYRAAQVLSSKADYVTGLSATPVYNFGGEIFNIMEVIAPGRLGTFEEFKREWCGNYYGDKVRVQDPKALGAYLRENHLMLRRTRAEIGRELPPVNKVIHAVDHDEKVVEQAEARMKQIAARVLHGSFVDRGQAARELDIHARMMTGIAKAQYVADYVRILLENGEKVLLAGWHRECFARDTQVLMRDGTSKAVQDIAVGDVVCGPDSTARNVLSLTRGSGRMFKITPKKGQPFVCSENHILTLCYNDRRQFNVVHIPAAEFFRKGERGRRNYCLMRSEAVTFHPAPPVFEPWFVGYWLGNGDGALREVSVCSMDQEVFDRVGGMANRCGMGIRVFDAPGVTGTSPAKHIRVSCGKPNGVNPVLRTLRGLGLQMNKHIPAIYKTSSLDERRQLLAGLLDSDGHVYRNGCGAEFSNTNLRLAQDVMWLCRSLGLGAYISGPHVAVSSPEYAKRDGSSTLWYRVSISGDLSDLPVIARKRADARVINKNVLRVGFSIEPIGVDEYFGFETDGDHLFLLDDFTVVHNCYNVWTTALAEFNPVMYTGSESPAAKEKAKADFISGKSQLMIISLRSGVGLDGLQKVCNVVVLGELDWSPGVHLQLIGRLARDGMTGQVTAIYLVSNSGTDPLIVDLLGLKSAQADGVMNPNQTEVTELTSDDNRIKMLAQRILDGKMRGQED